jgi:hypothetical protein
MRELRKKPFKFAVMGLIYGLVLATIGVVTSGGGHSNLITMLAVGPYGAGLLLWPILGLAASDMRPPWSNFIFLILMGVHYGNFILWLWQSWQSEMHWLAIAAQYAAFVIPAVLATGLYLLGQSFLWSIFLKHRSRPSN